jgi:hypothetical protein
MRRTLGKNFLLYALHARALKTLILMLLKKTKKQSTEKSLFIYEVTKATLECVFVDLSQKKTFSYQ